MADYTVYKKYPYLFCFIVSAVLLFAAFFNLHSAETSGDYIQTVGEIKNIESHKKHLRGRVRIEYDYDVIWEMDGQTFEKHFEGDWGRTPVEGPVDIWVSPDQTQVHFSSAEEIKKEAPIEIAIGVIAGIIGAALWKKQHRRRKYMSKAERMDRLENLQIGSSIGFFAFLTGAGFIGYDIYKEYQEVMTVNSVATGMMLVATVGMLSCIGIFVYATRKLK